MKLVMGNRGRKEEGKKMRSYETVEPEYRSVCATTLVYLVRNTMATIHLRPQTVRPPMTRVSGRGALYIYHTLPWANVLLDGVSQQQNLVGVQRGRVQQWLTDIWLLWPAAWLSDVSVNQSDALELMRSKTKELYLWIPRGNDEVISVFRRKHVH